MSYTRPTKFLTAIVVSCTMLAIPLVLFVAFSLAQEFGRASVKACCCLDETHK